MIYILLVLWILLLTRQYPKNNRNDRYVTLIFLALFIVMGFREAKLIGVDSTSSYLRAYQKAPTSSISLHEKNFSLDLLMMLMSTAGFSYQWFLIIEAAVVCGSYAWLIKKYSVNPLISVLWYMGMLYYVLMFSALKQAFAMAILCFAYDAIIQKKPIRFIVFVLMASTFHFPAIVFLPAYWIVKLKVDKHYVVFLIGLMAFVYLFRTQILTFMSNLYYEEDTHVYSRDVKFMGVKVILMFLIILAGIVLRTPDSQKEREYTYLMMLSGVAMVLQTYCYYNNIFERMADYYYVFSILYVPMIFEDRDNPMSLVPSDSIPLINMVGRLVVIAFGIWRFLSNILNDRFFNPFFFFWQR